MFKGLFTWKSAIVNKGVSFDLAEWTPIAPAGIDRVTIEASDAETVTCTTHFISVESYEVAEKISRQIAIAAIDRITYQSNTGIHDPIASGQALQEIDPKPGPRMIALTGHISFSVSCEGRATWGMSPDMVKREMDRPPMNGEQFLGMYRDASLSPGHVERYMHLYNLLLMLFDDNQGKVDAFIREKELGVSYELTKPSQNSNKPNAPETLYTRLRNEFAHVRMGVSIAATKEGMSKNWAGLKEIVKQAIAEH